MKAFKRLTLIFAVFLCACAADEHFTASREINVISREDGSGTRSAFIELLGVEVTDESGRRDETTTEAYIVNNTNTVIINVSDNLYSIGYISLGVLSNGVKTVDIDGAAATKQNVIDGTYPLFRSFDLVVTENMSPLARDFKEFILSEDGQSIVEARGYVTVNPGASPYSAENPAGTLVITGSTSVTPVMERLKEAYEALNAGVRVEIHMSGSSAGIASVISGTADIGMASRRLTDAEAQHVSAVPIALDGLAVIVNPDSPVTNLSKEEVRRIFTGEATHWNQVDVKGTQSVHD